VNKGKKKQLSSESRGKIVGVGRPPRSMVFEDRVEDEK